MLLKDSHYRSQGAIPERPAEGAPASCSSDHQAATFVVDNQIPSLAEMRANSNVVRQATQLVDSMVSGTAGTTSLKLFESFEVGFVPSGRRFCTPCGHTQATGYDHTGSHI
jgi:hypothetical protein